MMMAEDLKLSILQSAIEGKLTEQLFTDTPVDSTIKELRKIKNELIAKKEIKQTKVCSGEDEPPFSIPDSWSWVKLTDLGELSRGKSKHRPRNDISLYINGTIPLIQTGDVAAAKKYITKYNTCYNEVGLAQSRLWRKGTLCITIAANIGDVAILDFDACFPDSVLGFLPFSDSVNIEFVYFMLLAYKSRMNQKASKVAQSNLSLDKINTMLFPFAPIEEQQRIVDRVKVLMDKLDEFAEIEQQLLVLKANFPSDLRSAILQAAMRGVLTQQFKTDSSVDNIIQEISSLHKRKIKFIDDSNESFPESWRCIKLIDAAVLYTGNSISENIKAKKYAGQICGYDYIATKDVGFDNQISYDTGVRIPYDEVGFKYADRDATLLCIEGGSAGRKIAILDKKVCFGNKLCAFHPICINKKFLFYYLQSPLFLSAFRDGISGIIGGVSINKIKAMSIPIPPIEEQQRIVERLDALLPLCDTLIE